MESTPDWISQGTGNLLAKQGDGVLALWLLSALVVAFMLYLVIYPLVANYLRRRATTQESKIPALQVSESGRSSAPVQIDYLETVCKSCHISVFVPKGRRCKPFFCPSCGKPNPPMRREALGWAKSALRKLLYPSFQDFF